MDIDDIRSQLQSEKPTIRKKGKIALEDEVIKRKVSLSSYETMNLIYAVMNYEKREIDALLSKGKPVTADASQLFKQVIKHCLRYGQFISSKVIEVIDYSLEIFFDKGLPGQVKQIHKSSLCDIMETKIVYSIPFECKLKQTGWKRLFVYLKHIMVDKRSAADPMNLKLLKAISSNLYNDFHFQSLTSKASRVVREKKMRDSEDEMEVDSDEDLDTNYIPSKKILKPLFGWFRQLFAFADDNDENSLMIISSLYECLAAIVQFHSLNIMNLLIDELNLHYFRYLLKHICAVQYLQEKYSEPLLMFVYVLTDKLLHFSTNKLLFVSILGLPDFYPLLTNLYEGLISDEYLISILTGCRKKQNRKISGSTVSSTSSTAFINVIEDYPLGKLAYSVIVNVLRFYNNLWNRFSVKHDFLSFGEISGSDKNMCQQEEDENVSRGWKRSRKEKSLLEGFYRVFERIQSITLLSNTLHETDSENKISITNKRFFNNPVKKMNDRLLTNDIVLLESLLWIVIKGTSQERIEDFLASNARENSAVHLMTLNQWTTIIHQQFKNILQFKDEKQVIGVFLVALRQLWSLSSKLIISSTGMEFDEVLLLETKNNYIQLVNIMSENEKTFFKVLNGRIVGLSLFHSLLFHLLSVLLSHPLSDGASQFSFTLSKWLIFQTRQFIQNTTSDNGNDGDVIEDEEILIEPNEKFVKSTAAICCPYYLRTLQLLGRYQNSDLPPQTISGLFRQRKWFYLQAWFTSVFANPSFNYSFQTSFVQHHEMEVISALQRLIIDIFQDETTGYSNDVEYEEQVEIPIHWETAKDLVMLYPNKLSYSNHFSAISVSGSFEENREFREFLDECFFVWKGKIADLIKSSVPNSETIQGLLKIGLYLTCSFKCYGDLTRTSCGEIGDIIENILDCILVNFQLLNVIDIVHLIRNINFQQFESNTMKSSENFRELLMKILLSVKSKISKSRPSINGSSQISSTDADDFMDEIKDTGSLPTSIKSIKNESTQEVLKSGNSNTPVVQLPELLEFLLEIYRLQLSFTPIDLQKTVVGKLVDFFQQFLIFLVEEYQESSAEIVLSFAERISQASFPFNDLLLYEIIILFPWNKIHYEWAHLAYLKVFHVFFNLVSSPNFWRNRNTNQLDIKNDPMLQFILEKLFPGEGAVEEKMLHQIWNVRFYQMKIILELMKYVESINTIKAEVTIVFLSAIVDVDINVRMIAAEHVNLLFRHFKNPLKVYQSIHEKLCETFQSSVEIKDSDPLEAVVLFTLYVTTVAAGTQDLVTKTLSDLIQFVQPLQDTVVESSRPVYRDLILHSFSAMAFRLGYSIRPQFILEYLDCLLWIWLQNFKGSTVTSAEILLKDFPYELLFQEFHYFTWDKRESLFHCFLVDFGQFLMPSIIRISVPRARWAMLTAFSKGLYGGEGDSEIMKSLQSNYIPCKVYHIQLLVKCDLLKKTSSGTSSQQNLIDQNTKCKEIADFLSRLFPNKEANNQMKKDITGYFNQLIWLLTTFSSEGLGNEAAASTESLDVRQNSILLVKGFIFGFLSTLQRDLNLLNLNQLLSMVNHLDIFGLIFYRLQSTVSVSSYRNVLLFLLILLENSEFIANKRMVLVEMQRLFLHIVLNPPKHTQFIGEETTEVEYLPIMIDCYYIMLQKMKEANSLLNISIRYLWVKDFMFGVFFMYWILSDSSVKSTDGERGIPLSYHLLNWSKEIPWKVSILLIQRIKDLLTQVIEFCQQEVKSASCPNQRQLCSLLPVIIVSLTFKNPLTAKTNEEDLLLSCCNSLKETIDDILGGVDLWPSLLLLLVRLEELIDAEFIIPNDEISSRKQHSIHVIDENLVSDLLCVCQYLQRLKKTISFFRLSFFSQLTTIIIHDVNKIKSFLYSLQNQVKSAPLVSFAQTALVAYRPMNNVIPSTSFDPLLLQRQIIVYSYRLMNNSTTDSTYSIVSLSLTNLAIQGYFIDDHSSNPSQIGSSSSGSSQFTSVYQSSTDLSGSLSQSDPNLSSFNSSIIGAVSSIYESIISQFRLSSNYHASNNILSNHIQLDQELLYNLCEGDCDLCQSMFSDPAAFVWSEKLWNCNYFILYSASSGQSFPFKRHRLYSNWIRRLSFCIVQDFLVRVKNVSNNSTTKGKSGKSTKVASSNTKLIFLLSCGFPLSLLSVEISELFLLLVFNESIDVFGAQSSYVATLFDHINRFLVRGKVISGSPIFLECYQLVGHIFNLLLQKTINIQPLGINEIGEYQQQSSSSTRSKVSKELLYRKFAAQYHNNINLLDVIEVLYESNLLSSALLLSELVAESLAVKGLQDLKNKIYELSLVIKASSSTNVLGLRREMTLRDGDDEDNLLPADQLKEKYQSYVRLQKIFSLLYRKTNDVDAVEAINRSSDLQMQGICYQRKEQYFEALTTFESLLQAPSLDENEKSSHDELFRRDDIYSAIADSLSGLGASQTRTFYMETLKKEIHSSNQEAEHNLQKWSLRDSSQILYVPFTKKMVDGKKDNSAIITLSLGRTYDKFSYSISKLLKLENSDAVNNEILGLYDTYTIWRIKNLDPSAVFSTLNLPEAATKIESHKSLGNFSTGKILQDLLSRGSKVSDYQKNLNLIYSLLCNHSLTSLDGLLAINRVDDDIRNSIAIHSLSPAFYRCWNQIQRNVSIPNEQGDHSLQRSNGWNVSEQDVLVPMTQLQECKLLWKKGLSEAALDRLMNVILPIFSDIKERSKSVFSKSSFRTSTTALQQSLIPVVMDCLSEALRLAGLWNSRKGSKASQEIIQDYLQPAIEHAFSLDHKLQSYLSLANFTATLFMNIQTRIQSIEWIQSERVFRDREEELKLCLELQQELQRQQQPLNQTSTDKNALALQVQENRNLLRHIVMLKKEIDMDKKERNQLIQSYNQYLLLAIENYLKLLYLSADQDIDVVFQFINLWFKNNLPSSNSSSSETASSISSITVNLLKLNELILQYLQQQKILSYKFIPLHYQIFSRLGQSFSDSNITAAGRSSNDETGFQFLLQQFMQLLCYEHPYHVIPQLFALIHEQTVDSVTFKSNNQSSRSELAAAMLQRLLKPSTSSTSQYVALIKNMNCLLEGYHELAKTSTEIIQNAGRTKNIKFKEIQPRGKRFNEIMSQFVSPDNSSSSGSTSMIPAIITLSIPVNKWKKYDVTSSIDPNHNLIRMKEIIPVFHITENGISRPKIVSCLGENGIIYKQLVKGGDDMRQDAVMEQVFENINLTFQRNYETNSRNLLIRTYKVIPLTPQTGILQWVENTLPFGAILCDRVNGLHTRYQKTVNQDYSHKECREILQKCQDIQEKERKFFDIMQHFHPMFRYFFIEKFSSHPMEWMQKRLNYIKSVASNSMTGYILGIGDRHAHNILVDQITGECVHIDFGIVFDQGKGLGKSIVLPITIFVETQVFYFLYYRDT